MRSLPFLLIAGFVLVMMVGVADAENNTFVDAPDFTLTDTDGSTFNLSDYEDDKVVVMLFMFSTCEPTGKVVKDALGPYSEKMDNNSVAILSISVFGNDDENELRNYANEHDWRHALGEPDIENVYDVVGTPKIVIIDKNGKIIFSHLGPISLDELEKEVYNATLSKFSIFADEDEIEDKSSLMIPALITIGFLAILRKKEQL